MAEELGDSVEICAVCEYQGCKGVPADVEADVLGDACVLHDGLEADVGVAGLERELHSLCDGNRPLQYCRSSMDIRLRIFIVQAQYRDSGIMEWHIV